MIEISIFEKASKKGLLIYIGIGILTFLTLYLIFPKYGILSFFLPLLIFLIIITITERQEKPGGTIYLTERQIIIKTNQIDIKSEIFSIRKLILKYSGFKGKRLPLSFIPSYKQFSGSDNYISIDLGTKVYEYRFLVEDEIKERQIIELVSDWEKIGFDCSNIALNI